MRVHQLLWSGSDPDMESYFSGFFLVNAGFFAGVYGKKFTLKLVVEFLGYGYQSDGYEDAGRQYVERSLRIFWFQC